MTETIRQENPEDLHMLLPATANEADRMSGLPAVLNSEELSVVLRGPTALAKADKHNKEKHRDERNRS